MRIRGRNPPPPPSDRHHHHHQPLSSSPSASSSSSSSITAANSSLASSQDSSNSTTEIHRCAGLDLLVKAIHQVTAGSAVGVPYIQRRVTIRRRRRRKDFQFDAFVFSENFERIKEDEKKLIGIRKKSKKVSKVPDSVLQSWGRRSTAADVIGV